MCAASATVERIHEGGSNRLQHGLEAGQLAHHGVTGRAHRLHTHPTNYRTSTGQKETHGVSRHKPKTTAGQPGAAPDKEVNSECGAANGGPKKRAKPFVQCRDPRDAFVM